MSNLHISIPKTPQFQTRDQECSFQSINKKVYVFKTVIIVYLKDASQPKNSQTPLKTIPQKMHKLLHRFVIS